MAVQTVYLIFRTKGDLLQSVYEHVVEPRADAAASVPVVAGR